MSSNRPPKGISAKDWRELIDAATTAIADADMDPTKTDIEDYATAALRAIIARDDWSWRSLAGTLAERVYHSAMSDPHDGDEPVIGCGFCKDRLAYEAWERKARRTHRDPPPQSGAGLTLQEIRRGGPGSRVAREQDIAANRGQENT